MLITESPDFNEEQIEHITKLRELVSDIIDCEFEKTDIYLSKWLLVNRFNVPAAEKYFRAHKAWRKANNIDGILYEDLSEVEQRFPITIDGVDTAGRPLISIDLGPFELKKFLENGGREQFLRYVVQKFEKANQITRKQYVKTNGVVHQLVGILDFGGFSFRQLTSTTLMSVAIELAKVIEANYPCCCKTVAIVNAPRVIKILLATIKPFLSEDSASRIKVLHSQADQLKTSLLEYIDINQLPSKLGGTRLTNLC